MSFRNYNLNWQDQARLEKLEKKENEIQAWLFDVSNLFHPDFAIKLREQNILILQIYTIKKNNDPYKLDVFQPNIIIHPQPKRQL